MTIESRPQAARLLAEVIQRCAETTAALVGDKPVSDITLMHLRGSYAQLEHVLTMLQAV
jgi:hypothetical protein